MEFSDFIKNKTKTNNIVLTAGSDEMLRITEDGFYVRGVKVKQDDKEAEAVYNAFKQWMTFMSLTRNY